MPIPSRQNIHLPVLKVLEQAGSSLPSAEAVKKVKGFYPEMRQDDLTKLTSTGQNLINNRIRWARQDLALLGEIDGSTRGIWRITDAGRRHLGREWSTWKPIYSDTEQEWTKSVAGPTRESRATDSLLVAEDQVLGPLELIEKYRIEIEKSVETDLLDKLRDIEASAFEHVVAQLLEKLGYGSLADKSIRVTGRSHDGGIDGECSMDRLGLVKAKFQAKRYAKGRNVSSEELGRFIGSLEVERASHGVLVTTSDFTPDAIRDGKKSGKVKLVNGTDFAKLMIESGLGVRKKEIEIAEDIDEDYFNDLV